MDVNARRTRIKQMAALAGYGAATLVGAGATPALAAQTELEMLYAFPDLFRAAMQSVAKRFMAANPDVRIVFRAPAPQYEQVLQTVLRDAVAGTQPDIVEQGLNGIRAVSDQGVAVALDPFIAAQKDFASRGLNPEMLAAGQVKGRTYALPFAISLPVLYYNAELVKRAGGDPAHLPTTWDGVIDLAKRINALGGGTNGLFYAWDETGNWMWQALVFSRGGTMLDAAERKVAFDGAAGQWAIAQLARFVREARMPYLTHLAAREQFAAGTIGIFATSSAQLGAIQKIVAGRFALSVGVYPDLKPGVSRLPSGGNGLMVTAKDPARQRAAWRFVEFATRPEQAAEVARLTGYFPPDEKAGALLADFYRANPNFAVAVREQSFASAWYAFPGPNGLKIIDVIKDQLESVVSGRRAGDPGQVLASMAAQVQRLLPQ